MDFIRAIPALYAAIRYVTAAHYHEKEVNLPRKITNNEGKRQRCPAQKLSHICLFNGCELLVSMSGLFFLLVYTLLFELESAWIP